MGPSKQTGAVAFEQGSYGKTSALARLDFASPRLFVDQPFTRGEPVRLDRDQSHYLATVLRLTLGERVLAFNGRDGEWRAALGGSKSAGVLELVELVRPQPEPSRLHYCFAPLKHARLDYLVQKAVEMGAGVLQPVLTRRTQAARVNLDRMRANAIEAAEQCGVLAVPVVQEPVRFVDLIGRWAPADLMVFCDEDADVADPIDALRRAGARAGNRIGVIVGPEGGFEETEREALLTLPRRVRLSLGPRILRADTAAVAALALIQAVMGDGAPLEPPTAPQA